MPLIPANSDFMIFSRYMVFHCELVLFLFIGKKLTNVFNISHWIYSFGLVFKVHSFCTFLKSFMFLVYIFTFKCFNVFFWIDGKSHKTRVIDMFNLRISKHFLKNSLPQIVLRTSAMYQIYLKFHFQQSLRKDIRFIFHLLFHFLVYRCKWKNTSVIGVCQVMT